MQRFAASAAPLDLLIANTLLTAVYAVGVVAATYASILNPGTARTAILLSAVVNGFGTIAMAFIVDPRSASVVDRAVRGERTLDDVKALIFWLAVTAIVGTLLSQLLLTPAAWLIGAVAHLFSVK
jgi:hypothetical protein